MTTSVVTGGAGFLGSHLCDALLAKGHRVLCVDNLETGSLANIEHMRSDEFVFLPHDVIEPIWIDEPVDFVYHLASPASPIDYLRLPLVTRSRSARTAPTTRSAWPKFKRARFLLASHERGLRRPAGAPAARELLGPRQPDRPARRLRRGEAVRRGAHDGLPPPARASTPRIVRIFNTYGPRMRPNDGRAIPDLRAPGPRAEAAHRLRRRPPDPQLLLRRRPRPRPDRASPRAASTCRSTSATRRSSRCSSSPRKVIEVFGGGPIVFEALPVDDPKSRHPDITRAQPDARLGARGLARRGAAPTADTSIQRETTVV